MKLPVIRNLAKDHDLATLNKAAVAFEENRENSLGAEGADEGEILTHLLLAAEVRKAMEEQGLSLQDAIRAQGQRVQKLLGKT